LWHVRAKSELPIKVADEHDTTRKVEYKHQASLVCKQPVYNAASRASSSHGEASTMPRFGTGSLLIAVAIAAVWFSTFAGYSTARDVRASVLLLIFLASGFAAVCSWRERRAFWIGFFAVMLVCGGNDLQRPLNRYVPNFLWLSNSPYVPPTSVMAAGPALPLPWEVSSTSQPVRSDALAATIAAAWILGLATLAGLIGVFIYRQHAKE
jgi:hypothetical protein